MSAAAMVKGIFAHQLLKNPLDSVVCRVEQEDQE
jgi:hypothetical protein